MRQENTSKRPLFKLDSEVYLDLMYLPGLPEGNLRRRRMNISKENVKKVLSYKKYSSSKIKEILDILFKK